MFSRVCLVLASRANITKNFLFYTLVLREGRGGGIRIVHEHISPVDRNVVGGSESEKKSKLLLVVNKNVHITSTMDFFL